MTAPTFAAPLQAGHTAIGDAIVANARRVIAAGDANSARSRQRELGPSEYGHPCDRRLAYAMLSSTPPPNTTVDPWARIVGTAVHAWLAETFLQSRELLDDGLTPRYRVEQRVTAYPGISGTADLLDRKLGVVIDWKIPGLTAVREARKHGPGEAYRVQAHTYGTGYVLAGEQVEHVAVVMLPKAGTLADAYVWTEPLDLSVVPAAAKRLATILEVGVAVMAEEHPERFRLIPATPTFCSWCPFYAGPSAPPALGCDGVAT
jgi:hypothetical protein